MSAFREVARIAMNKRLTKCQLAEATSSDFGSKRWSELREECHSEVNFDLKGAAEVAVTDALVVKILPLLLKVGLLQLGNNFAALQRMQSAETVSLQV